MSPETKPKIEYGAPEQKETIEEPTPWEGIGDARREETIEEYKQEFALEDQVKDEMYAEISNIAKEKEEAFALNWIKDHKDELVEQGIDIDTPDKALINIAFEKGALNELKKNKEYADTRHELGNLDVVLDDIKKGDALIESRLIALNILKDREDAFELRKQIAESIIGADLDGEAQKQVDAKRDEIINKALGEKNIDIDVEQYVEDNGNKMKAEHDERAKRIIALKDLKIQEEWDALPNKNGYNNDIHEFADSKFKVIAQNTRPDLETNDVLIFLEKGYKPQDFVGQTEGHLFWKKQMIQLKPGETVSTKKFYEDIQKNRTQFFSENKSNAENSLREKHNKICRDALDGEKQNIVSKKMEELSNSVEGAINGTEGVYQEIKDKRIASYEEKGLRKEKKTGEQIEAIEKRFETKDKPLDTRQIVSEIASRNEEFEDLTGDKAVDGKDIAAFLSRHELVDLGKKKSVAKFMDQEKYKEALKTRRGLIGFMLDLIDEIMAAPAKKEAEKKKTEAQKKRAQSKAEKQNTPKGKTKKEVNQATERALKILRKHEGKPGSKARSAAGNATSTSVKEARKLMKKQQGNLNKGKL